MILFECLAGRRPFEHDSDFALLLKVRTESPPSPRAFAPDLPRDPEMICPKCLSKPPHERYATASEFAADLGRYLAGQPVRARPVPPSVRLAKWARRNKALAGLVAAGLAVAVVGPPTVSWLWLRAERANAEIAQALGRETEAKAARAKAEKLGVPMNVAVVDSGANLLAFARMDGAWLGSGEIARNKAYTARAFDTSTKALGKISQPGDPAYGIRVSTDHRIAIFPGGIPLMVGKLVVGAVGVSGGTPDQDQTVAEAAVAAFVPAAMKD